MAQTPKLVSSKKTTASQDTLEPQKKSKPATKKTSASKPNTNNSNASKFDVNKPKMTAAKKAKPAEAHDSNALVSVASPDDFATPVFLNTHTPIETTPLENNTASNSDKLNDVNDIESMDFNMPIASEHQQEGTIDDTPTAFAGFIVPSGCGNILKAEREAQGLSLSEVCKALRLSVNQIQAIEEDDFANLPKQSIVRGFIRNYARLLKMDAEPILKAFQNIAPDEAPLSLSVKSTAEESVIGAKEMKFTPKIIANITLSVLVLLALAYLYTHYIKPHAKTVDGLTLNADEIQKISPDMMPLTLPNTDPTQTENQATPASSADNTSTENTSADNTSATVTFDNASNVETTMAATFEKKLTTQSTAVNPQTTTAQTSSPSTIPTANINVAPLPGESQLSFNLAEQSWVRVEAADGKKIFSELLQAGSQTINAKPPFTIIIGNAKATKVAINHLDYDLTPVTRANVARVQIK